MPMNLKDYHPQWKAISKAIIDRAFGKCELCKEPNEEVVFRTKKWYEKQSNRTWYFGMIVRPRSIIAEKQK